MKKKINNTQYTDELILLGKRVKDFLPKPEELILKKPTTKITKNRYCDLLYRT